MKRHIHTAAFAMMATTAMAATPSFAATEVGPDCAGAFASADADNDGMVRRDEAAAFSAKAFERFDANDDGAISREEYGACLSAQIEASMDEVLDDGDAQDRTTGAQSGESGDAKDAEVSAAATTMDRTLHDEAVSEWMSARDDRSFETADANRDGAVDRTEWAQAVREAHDELTSADIAGRNLQQGDAEDGMKSGDEAAAAGDAGEAGQPAAVVRRFVYFVPAPGGAATQERIAGASAEDVARRARHGFDLTDRDGDGRVTREEWSGESGHPILGRGFAESFQQLDENGDGRVSVSEYRAASEDAYAAARDASAQDAQAGSEGVPVILYHLHSR